MANESSNVKALPAAPERAQDSAADQFIRLAGGLTPSVFKKTEYEDGRRFLGSAAITQENAADICSGLSQFQMPYSGEMLAEKWSSIPPDARVIFLRWKWDLKEKSSVAANCTVAASGMLAVDRASALDLLAHAVQLASGIEAKRSAMNTLRTYWLAPKKRVASLPVPLEQLTWSDLDPRWREPFLRFVTDAACGENALKKESLPLQLRQTAARWMRNLAVQAGADGATLLQPFLIRLDPSLTAVQPAASSPLAPAPLAPAPPAPVPPETAQPAVPVAPEKTVAPSPIVDEHPIAATIAAAPNPLILAESGQAGCAGEGGTITNDCSTNHAAHLSPSQDWGTTFRTAR